MDKKITILSPLFIKGDKINYYKKCIKSFYDSIEEPYPLHIIKDDSSQETHEEVKKLMKEINPNHIFLDRKNKTNGFTSVSELIDYVETKYFLFLIDDAIMTVKENIIEPIVEHMDKDEKTIQVKIGGGLLCNGTGKTNKDNIIKHKDNTVSLYSNKEVKYKPYVYGDNIVWVMDLKSKNTLGEMPISFWNCVHRTEIFKKINDIIKNKKGPKKYWSHYQAFVNYTGGRNNIIKKNGWPKDFEFLDNYKSGWLNMCCYLYPFNRCRFSLNDFKKTHTIKIN